MTDNKKKTHLIVTGRGGGTQVQADWSQTDSEQPDYIKNKPELATVATSGDYDDLQNKPTIPAAQVQSDWNAVSGMGEILNKPSLATVATSGNYSDLNGTPTLATVATSGSYNDLQDKPTIPAAQIQSDWNQSDNTQVDYIKNKPTILTQWFGTKQEYDAILVKDPDTIYHIEGGAPVQSDWNEADSSSLAYIANKPTIPAAQVNSDWNAVSGVAQILNKPTIPVVPAMATETLTFTLQGGTTKTIEFYTVPNYFYVEDISGSNNTLSINKNNANAPTIEVFSSTDKINWTSMGTTSTTGITATIPANGKLYLKCTANIWTNYYGGRFNRIVPSGNFNVGGNILSLIYGDNFEGKTGFPTGSEYNLCNLFNTYYGSASYNTKLRNANKLILPSTVNKGSYASMFAYCSGLLSAPILYATILAQECYTQMFRKCDSLNTLITYASNISATDCLNDWFRDITQTTGDFYNLGGATYPSGTSGIPTGWTEHTSL